MGKYSIPYLDPMGMNISQLFTNTDTSYISNIASINPIRGKSNTFRTRIPQKKTTLFWILVISVMEHQPAMNIFSCLFIERKTWPIVVCHTSVDDCNHNFDHHWVMQICCTEWAQMASINFSIDMLFTFVYSFFANASLSKLSNLGGFSYNDYNDFQPCFSYQFTSTYPIPSIYPIYWPIYLFM